ncbi:biliverdin-producing heme oxygenase [Pirellulaceae bacterium SH449]
MSVMNLVRSAISASHHQIEQTPFSTGMMDGRITKEDYSRGLSQLWHIHKALESSVQTCSQAAEFFTDEMIRTDTIARDLKAFGFQVDSFDVLPETALITEKINAWGATVPHALLGCIYILEGSRMGSLVIAKPLGRTLGLTAGEVSGLEYHLEGAAQTPARLREFKARVDSAGLDDQAEADLIEGAVQFMDMLNTLYEALPVNEYRSDASQHRMTA